MVDTVVTGAGEGPAQHEHRDFDLDLLVNAGVEIAEDGTPVYDPATFETNVPGIYVAGHITLEKHFKGALTIAPRVVEQIAAAREAV